MRTGNHRGWQVTITNTSEDLRKSLVGLGGRFYFPKRTKSSAKDKELREQVWVWKVAAAWDVHRILKAVEPYLRIKRAKALRTIQEIEERWGAPPPGVVDVRDAVVVLEGALSDALAAHVPSVSRPPLRAGQLSFGV